MATKAARATTRQKTTKRATSTNGGKPAKKTMATGRFVTVAPARMVDSTRMVQPKTAVTRKVGKIVAGPAMKSSRAAKPKTANEALLVAWQHDYETRHKQTKKRA